METEVETGVKQLRAEEGQRPAEAGKPGKDTKTADRPPELGLFPLTGP